MAEEKKVSAEATEEFEEKEQQAEEQQTEDAAEAEKETDKKEKKGLGKKNKKEKTDKKDEKIADLTDRVQRQMAEFDNFRKRTEKEKSQMFDMGAKSIIEKVLPVIDSFERALAGVAEDAAEDAFVDGMNKIYKQMFQMLEQAGVSPIEAVGKEFDPNYHNAVMHIEDDSFGENEIVEEFQKGYMYHDSVIRHSMVKVAN